MTWNNKGKGRKKIVKDPAIIRSLIEFEHFEALKKESIERNVTMNSIVREMLERRYSKKGTFSRRWLQKWIKEPTRCCSCETDAFDLCDALGIRLEE